MKVAGDTAGGEGVDGECAVAVKGTAVEEGERGAGCEGIRGREGGVGV